MKRRTKQAGRLESELGRLKRVSGWGHELRVEWIPGQVKHFRGKELSGEVLDGTIYIYDRDEERALSTLRHEFLDNIICRAIDPFKKIANKLIAVMNEEAYREKEHVVERLLKLID